jgi:hypothetical protein
VNLPTSNPKDPLSGGSYNLQIQFDMIYNTASKRSYSFNSGRYWRMNDDDPKKFFLSLPQSMIVSFVVPQNMTLEDISGILKSKVTAGNFGVAIGFYKQNIPVTVPTWKISTKFTKVDLLLFDSISRNYK